MVPYFKTQGEGLSTVILEASGKRAIGLCYIDSDVLVDDTVEVDIRGKRLKAVIPARHMSVGAPPFARPLLYGEQEEVRTVAGGDRTGKALALLHKAIENHVWRQEQCVNLIPSENTPSRAVRLLSGSDPACRYAEHKKILAFYEKEVFYYQGTKFIDQVERMLTEEMRAYFGCTEVETRTLSGQMSNMAVFSALTDWKNRFDRKKDAKRLGYVMNNHIIKGGHLSAQPMGALHDYIAVDPVTEKPAVVNFPVCRDNPYKMDVEETKKLIDRYRPELIIFGKSMVLHKEPVAQIRRFVDEQKIPTTIMYDMAHVLGLIGDHFQNPFQEGAEIVTGSTHKTFFGPQRGVIGVNYKEEDLKYGLWKTIESRHEHTQLGAQVVVGYAAGEGAALDGLPQAVFQVLLLIVDADDAALGAEEGLVGGAGDDLRALLEGVLEVVADEAQHMGHIVHNGGGNLLLVHKAADLGHRLLMQNHGLAEDDQLRTIAVDELLGLLHVHLIGVIPAHGEVHHGGLLGNGVHGDVSRAKRPWAGRTGGRP